MTPTTLRDLARRAKKKADPGEAADRSLLLKVAIDYIERHTPPGSRAREAANAVSASIAYLQHEGGYEHAIMTAIDNLNPFIATIAITEHMLTLAEEAEAEAEADRGEASSKKVREVRVIALHAPGAWLGREFFLDTFGPETVADRGDGFDARLDISCARNLVVEAAYSWANHHAQKASLGDSFEVFVYVLDEEGDEIERGIAKIHRHPDGGWSHDGVHVHNQKTA